jgi:two-component system, OmpR family, sensor kinase
MSVRLRVTLAFTAVMAVVLCGAGLFLYLQLGSDLDASIASNLRSRTAELSAVGRLPTSNVDAVAQIIEPSGRVAAATAEAGRAPLLTGAQRTRALRGAITFDRRNADDHLRLRAVPAQAGVVVVGEDLDPRDAAVSRLGTLLLIGGPVLLLLAALAGYGATAAALRPVERMRARAAEIEATDPGARLPVPDSDDEIGRLGATLNALLDRLEAAFTRERAFVADASHELRTPLAILKTELELALRRGRTEEELTAALRSAAEETDRLVALAEDLLVIARADQGRLPIRVVDLRAADVLARARDRYAPQATIDGVDGLVLRADPVRLEQALGNLLDNARRYGGEHVELAAERRGGVVRLHVRDDGPGLPDGDAAFERFHGRGAGLGLAIVAAIAHAHGGEVGVDGADVWIELPCAS